MVINASTSACFLIGKPVSQSKSPQFQNLLFDYYQINAVYLALEILPQNFDSIISGLKKITLQGMNVTFPYKRKIMTYCDQLSQEASQIQAVNTIVIQNGQWKGYNTDWYGVYKTLQEHNIAREQEVLIIGAGGAAYGLIYGLKKYGIKNITLTNRTMDKAFALAEVFSIRTIDYDQLSLVSNQSSLLINATTVGFERFFQAFDDQKIYFDLKYYGHDLPVKNYINGLDMLIYQGARSFQLWTGIEPDIDLIKKGLR